MSGIADVVAMLTAHHRDGGRGAEVVSSLTDDERRNALDIAIGMLAREIELGCADSGIGVEEYLQLAGLAAANGTPL